MPLLPVQGLGDDRTLVHNSLQDGLSYHCVGLRQYRLVRLQMQEA